MKNDLTYFEKNLLKIINLKEGTKYNYKHLMEWTSSKKIAERNLQDGEILYEVDGIFVAIKNKEK